MGWYRGGVYINMAVCPEPAGKWWKEHSQSLRRLLEVLLSFGCGVLNIVSFGSPYWLDFVSYIINI